mmetsp:Transcript_3772/g.4240  ORF Transcript_3772/g.4240 Transcript_3772/m.4240 type:complete len:208 (-) Transcript_3772:3087-3710(-)
MKHEMLADAVRRSPRLVCRALRFLSSITNPACLGSPSKCFFALFSVSTLSDLLLLCLSEYIILGVALVMSCLAPGLAFPSLESLLMPDGVQLLYEGHLCLLFLIHYHRTLLLVRLVLSFRLLLGLALEGQVSLELLWNPERIEDPWCTLNRFVDGVLLDGHFLSLLKAELTNSFHSLPAAGVRLLANCCLFKTIGIFLLSRCLCFQH